MSEDRKKTCILVIGMHRSGTSATAGVLHILGADLGKQLLPPGPDNPKGYFENKVFYILNEELLKALNTSWHDLNTLPDNWQNHDKIQPIKNKIKDAFTENFGLSELFVIKDPRICLLLPLYTEIIKELGYILKIILTRRETAEIVDSLIERDKFSADKAIRLCHKYDKSTALYLIQYNLDHTVVYFDELINNPQKAVNKITDYIPALSSKYEECKQKINLFLETNLKHYNSEVILYFIEENNKLRAENLHLNTQAKHLSRQIENIHSQIEDANRELDDIKNSISWNFVKKIKNILDWIFKRKNKTDTYYTKIILFLRKIFISPSNKDRQ